MVARTTAELQEKLKEKNLTNILLWVFTSSVSFLVFLSIRGWVEEETQTSSYSDPSWTSWGVPRKERINNPSLYFWFCPGVSFQWDIPHPNHLIWFLSTRRSSNSDLPPDDGVSHLISEVEPSEETHVSPGSHSFCHDTNFMTAGGSQNLDRPVNQQLSGQHTRATSET